MPNRWIEYVKKFARENNMTYGCALSDPVMKAGYKKIPKRTQKAEREQMGAEDSDAPAPPPDPEIAKRAKKVERARVAREGIKRKMDERVAMGKEDVNVAKKKKKRVAKKKIKLVLVEDDDDSEKSPPQGKIIRKRKQYYDEIVIALFRNSYASYNSNKVDKMFAITDEGSVLELVKYNMGAFYKEYGVSTIRPPDPVNDYESISNAFNWLLKTKEKGEGDLKLKDDEDETYNQLDYSSKDALDLKEKYGLTLKVPDPDILEIFYTDTFRKSKSFAYFEGIHDLAVKNLKKYDEDEEFRRQLKEEERVRARAREKKEAQERVEWRAKIREGNKKLSGKGTGASTMTPTLEDRWNGFLLTPEGEMVKRIYDDKRISHSQLRWATEEALEGNENINISQEQYENEVENQFSNKYHRSIEQYFTDHLEEAVPIFEPELEVMEGNGMRGGCGKCSHLFFNDVLF